MLYRSSLFCGTTTAGATLLLGFALGSTAGLTLSASQCFPIRTKTFPCSAVDAVELGRFVLLDDVPGNGETWFLARCFAALRKEGLTGVVSFSDPSKRLNADGVVVFGGHIGTIYQAHNAVYLGRGSHRNLYLLPSGQAVSHRAISKIRGREVGWRYAVGQLETGGAPTYSGGDLRDWLGVALASCRKLKHRGCHKYAWVFSRTIKLSGIPFPKEIDE